MKDLIDIKLKNYTATKRMVRINDEYEHLFLVNNSTFYKRGVKDADILACEIVDRFNDYPLLKKQNEVLLDALERAYAKIKLLNNQ